MKEGDEVKIMWVDENEEKIYIFIKEDRGFYIFRTKDDKMVQCRPSSLSLCEVVNESG